MLSSTEARSLNEQFSHSSTGEILAELEKAETYEKPGRAQELNRELGHVQHDLAELNPRWEKQATRLAALE